MDIRYNVRTMNSENCYTTEQLRDYLFGKLDEANCEVIDQHVSDCEKCGASLVQLEAESEHDTFVRKLVRGDVGSDEGDEPRESSQHFQNAVDRLIEQGRESLRTDAASQKQIGDYLVLAPLGAGGMGRVFLARHKSLGKQVAIKILPERKVDDAEAIARFTREMKIIGKMSHPAMVAATDAGKVMVFITCLLYTSPSPRDATLSRMPSSA